jgi:5'-nucleotidase
MRRLMVGMDDILADTHQKLVDLVLHEFDTLHSRSVFFQRPLKELLHPKQLDRLHRLVNQPGFFADLPVKPGAVETVRRLSQYYELVVVTDAMEFPNSFRDKYDWLRRHFAFIPLTNLVFCGCWDVLVTDYLIDDQPRHLRAVRGKGILFSAPHNLKATGFERVQNWEEIAELFLPVP